MAWIRGGVPPHEVSTIARTDTPRAGLAAFRRFDLRTDRDIGVVSQRRAMSLARVASRAEAKERNDEAQREGQGREGRRTDRRRLRPGRAR